MKILIALALTLEQIINIGTPSLKERISEIDDEIKVLQFAVFCC